ncbi:MAG TPA: SBBP repeat-containing protein [Verrucomicrobiae bacterium]|nr:SBBP repeat-containing protein [Verrucomicrobiae bacterium]
MKTFLSLPTTLLGLGCAGALNVFAFTPLPPIPAGLGNLPLCFEANPDQLAGPARFITRGCHYQFLLLPTEVQIARGNTGVQPAEVRMHFAGANPGAQMSGGTGLPGKINYLIGNNPAQWHTGVATFAQVRVEQLYPGINLVYYGNQQQLEYDFNIAPGADPEAIKIQFNGVDKISIGARGELILAVGGSEIRQPAPVIYQTPGGQRQAIRGGYRLVDAHTIAFAVGKYDQKLPLVIDPILSFSTYFGGNSSETASSVALDTNGFIYIAGQTLSSQFPANSHPRGYQTNFAGGSIIGDAFVAKFDNLGTNLVYLTYLGGSADDAAYALAVDAAGDVYVTGFTDSPNFPVTNTVAGGVEGLSNSLHISGIVEPTGYYPADAFVAELSPNGSNLVYSTYLGGSATDAGIGIAVDASGDAYVTGVSYSTNFPTSPNAFQKNLAVTNWAYQAYFNANAFVTEIGADGTNLLYSSYLGGTNFDQGDGIAVDLSNNVYVTGLAASTNFPTTNAVQQQFVSVMFTTNAAPTNQVLITNFFNGYLLNGTTNLTSADDAFVAKFAPGCTSLIYSTFLGGTNSDVANGIAVDGAGHAYVTGWTVSTNFPNTLTNVAGLYNGLTNNTSLITPLLTNAFLTQVTWSGSNAAIGYSTVFGGTNFGMDVGYGVTLDASGNVFVVGASSTTNFPAVNTPGLLHTTNAGGSDAFIIAFNTNATSVLFSGYLGGSGNDFGYGVAVDSLTNVYLAGQTASPDFPVFGTRQSSLDGPSDAFLAKILWTVQPVEITNQPTNQVVSAGTSSFFGVSSASLVVGVTGTPPLSYQWQFQGTNLVWTNLVNGGTNLLGGGRHISGATNAILTISCPETNDSGNYQVIITNYAGSVTSSVATLTVTNIPTVFTQQPNSQTVGTGSTAQFNFNATFQQPATAQWLKDGTNLINGGRISGESNSFTLTINNAGTNDDGTYWVVVTTPWGSLASSNAVLTVVSLPTITVPPTNQTVGLGATVTFAVTAVGLAPLSYRWQMNGTSLVNGGHLSGVTNSALILSNAQTSDDGGYTVIVTNSVGSVTSSPPAVLTVLTAPLFRGITAGTNGGFILSGVGGTNSGSYTVLTSTNLAIPPTLWTPVATNQFGSQGQFVFTNIAPTDAPQLFYLLQMQ